jgi:hypothetical protein
MVMKGRTSFLMEIARDSSEYFGYQEQSTYSGIRRYDCIIALPRFRNDGMISGLMVPNNRHSERSGNICR